MRGREDECARPDCSFPGHAEAEGEFVVERIIGRKPTAGSRTKFLWLIKWDGFVNLSSLLSYYSHHLWYM
jgi:hypothetical protein